MALDTAGRSQFYESLRRRAEPVFYAFDCLSLDGHDLHEPQELRSVRLPIGAAQRYDLEFVMSDGPVALISTGPGHTALQ